MTCGLSLLWWSKLPRYFSRIDPSSTVSRCSTVSNLRFYLGVSMAHGRRLEQDAQKPAGEV